MRLFYALFICLCSTEFVYAGGAPASLASVYIVDTFYENTNKINLFSNGKYINSNTDVLRSYVLKKTDEQYFLSLGGVEFFSLLYENAEMGKSWKSGPTKYSVVSTGLGGRVLTISATNSSADGCYDGVRTAKRYFSFDLDVGLVSSVRHLEDCNNHAISGSVVYSFHWW